MEQEQKSIINNLDILFERLDYSFNRIQLLEEAFRHSSFVNELGVPGLKDNERLEFLGDAVLDLAVSHILMDHFKNAKEGDLSKFRAAVVNEKGLVQIADELNLGNYILLGKGEESTNGRKKPSILANTVEAMLGAIYLDAGFERTKQVIQHLFFPLIEQIDSGNINDDYKSLLQEFTQDFYKTRPEYRHIHESGPAHNRTFKVVIRINGTIIAEGIGKSKKEAEQHAAREAFHCLSGQTNH
ncbi:MAG: ribonuclease III [Deltaproteobacteria bacterium]|nr:ribonuclease III [Deltaproteobacteria bacterium]